MHFGLYPLVRAWVLYHTEVKRLSYILCASFPALAMPTVQFKAWSIDLSPFGQYVYSSVQLNRNILSVFRAVSRLNFHIETSLVTDSRCTVHWTHFNNKVCRPACARACIWLGVGLKLNNIYLVDPASSHMLVSKIKPCMSKYGSSTVKLRMAH